MPGRAILPPDARGWNSVAITEWSLDNAEWTDSHPFDEINYVLEGTLTVESEGNTVTAEVGDTVIVTAGSIGCYRARGHARMLAIYAPNPDAQPSRTIGYRTARHTTDS